MPAAQKQWLRTAVTSVRTAITAGALTLLVGLGAVSVLSAPQEAPPEQLGLSGQDAETSRLLEHNNCSVDGFDPDVIPTKAVIRDGGGTRVVSFDHGWAVFKKERPGVLVAVCLGPEHSARR